MKIGIQHAVGSFSENWIKYCVENNLEFKLVNCFQTDIIDQLKDCDVFMWHWHHGDFHTCLFARQLIYSLELSGKKIFPDSNTCWHFDDKVGQKYLLEAMGAPLVPSFIFYNKQEALRWIESTHFPKVFKLRVGAESTNVRLVKNKKDAQKLVQIAFSKGFSVRNRKNTFNDRLRKFKRNKNFKTAITLIKGIGRLFIPYKLEQLKGREKGYVYFQDFMKNNRYDLRVIVIADKAFGFLRYVRENDFRASGSGLRDYNPDLIDERCLLIAFDVAKKLKTQSIAFDFIFDEANSPLICEISYGFGPKCVENCLGFWDRNLNWHSEKFKPEDFMMTNIILQQQLI